MILKKQEKNGTIKAMYSSSTVCASIYNTQTKDLIVIFNNGGQYKYPGVDNSDYVKFETSDSNGTTFNATIKKKYTNFEKLDKLEETTISAILKEISELKVAEDKIKPLMEVMSSMVATYISNGKVDDEMLKKLQIKITEHESSTNTKPSQGN